MGPAGLLLIPCSQCEVVTWRLSHHPSHGYCVQNAMPRQHCPRGRAHFEFEHDSCEEEEELFLGQSLPQAGPAPDPERSHTLTWVERTAGLIQEAFGAEGFRAVPVLGIMVDLLHVCEDSSVGGNDHPVLQCEV